MFDLDHELLHVVRQWVQKAENDLMTAVQTLKLGAYTPTDTVCFHAQQCVEKYVKALLTLHGVDFARTHHINMLTSLLPVRVRPDLTPQEQALFSDYAVATRYPGDYERISLTEARHAVQIARRVRRQIRPWLPKESLRPL